MQAVILCAGKGTRMGHLTENIPKPLLTVGTKTLLEHKLDALPSSITEIVLIIGHLGNKIREKIGSEYSGKAVRYVIDHTLTGTAHALWQAKSILRDRFLVMMGDDIYAPEAIEECAQHDFSIACIEATRNQGGSRVLLNTDNHPIKFVTHKMYLTLREDGGMIFTGLYSLTPEIFSYEPVKLETKEEWGLPNTLLKNIDNNKVKIIKTDFWLPVGNPEELSEAEKFFSH